jgi:hypothetical protein
MGKVLSEISDRESSFIAKQKLFFVATAPLSGDHHVSISPKAPGNSCVVLDPHTVAYADLTGSGSETAAHVLQNGRMTLMFINIEDGPPKILRLFGNAEIIMPDRVPDELKNKFPRHVTESFGFRAVYKLNVTRISTSCGYSMPIMEFQKYRTTLDEFVEKQGQKGMFDYTTKKNSFSIDGLPSLGQLRHDAPTIEACPEEGYIYGKIIRQSGAHVILQSKSPQTTSLRTYYLVLFVLSIFVLGVSVGAMLFPLYFLSLH